MMKKITWRGLKFIMYGLLVLVKAMFFIVVREVTLRKRAEVHANEIAQREAQRRMNEFLNLASHELKTPLTSIKGNIQLMGRRLKSGIETQATQTAFPVQGAPTAVANVPAGASMRTGQERDTNRLLLETRDLLERTDRQVAHLTRLVNALLETSRLDNNSLNLRLEPYEMNKLVREVARDTHYVPAIRNVHIEASEEDLVVLVDSQRIGQVVVHFLSNAHKFSPLEERIDVVLEREDDNVRVSVHDAGPGIPLSEHNRVWERFYRVPDIEVRNGSEVGLGLGLYLSHIIVEQHQGSVGLKSTPGDGSTFWFTLPLMHDKGTIA